MKLKKNKKQKKDQVIETLVAKTLAFLMDEPIWTWADLSLRLNIEDDPSLVGNIIHRLKRSGCLRALNNYEPGVRFYEPSYEHIMKLRTKYYNV